MNYRRFTSNLTEAITGSNIKTRAFCFEHTLEETSQGVLIDRKLSQFSSLEEAKQFIKDKRITNSIQDNIQEQLHANKVVNIIKDHHGEMRVTDTLVEAYVEMASSKLFTLDPVVHDIREHIDSNYRLQFMGKLQYKLDDGSIVAINEDTLHKINNIFNQHTEVIDFMRSSVDNFLSVVDQIEDH